MIQRTVERLRAEFLEMPGMRLTRAQIQRLCGVDTAIADAVLAALVEAKFLCVRPDGSYVRLTEGAAPRPRPARADLYPAARRHAS